MQQDKISDLPQKPMVAADDIIEIESSAENASRHITISGVLSRLHPVGSLYFNASDPSSPSTLLGFGTWVAFGAGRVLVGFDVLDDDFNTAEKTGGHKDMQEHNHGIINGSLIMRASIGPRSQIGTGSNASYVSLETANAGTGDSGNLQPYITVYIWKRTT